MVPLRALARTLAVGLLAALVPVAAKVLEPADLAGLKDVAEPQLSADGAWLAYTVRSSDLAKDQRETQVWVCRWDGSDHRALPLGEESQAHPRWSPDGRWIAFLTSRGDDHHRDQIWLWPIRGEGQAQKLTSAPGGIEDFAWSPDSRHLALICRDADSRAASSASASNPAKTPPPWVIDRYQFKEDVRGYLTDGWDHLALFDLDSKTLVKLTAGKFDDAFPAWSPDGRTIAFASKRGDDPDRTERWDVYLIEARAGAQERAITRGPQANAHPDWRSPPAWSPDGRTIAFVRGGPPEQIEYAAHPLATLPAGGGECTVLFPLLDRPIFRPQWAREGLYALEENDGAQTLMEFSAGGSAPRSVVGGNVSITGFSAAGGHIAVLLSTPDRPFEIFAAEGGRLRCLSGQNDAWLSQFTLGKTVAIRFPSQDGTDVHGFVVFSTGEIRPSALAPATWVQPRGRAAEKGLAETHGLGSPRPTLLRLHGGPQSQYQAQFSFEAQLFANHGYNVLLPNPRGSGGRGTPYALSLYAHWGTVDVQDDLAAVDYAVAQGWVDPERLGVGGWSYGAISTNYLNATTGRFKAATAGAGTGNILGGFGTNEYLRDYEVELGWPWQHLETWLNLSYPFFHADRIHTPTLYLACQNDVNVPVLGSEQMYQALRVQGVPTELVIYPGQYHILTKPSYQRDLYERYLAWYARWIPALR